VPCGWRPGRPSQDEQAGVDAATVAAFEAAIAAVPQIRHAERFFGDPDYLLRVVAADHPTQGRPSQRLGAPTVK
jgi:hypothetical protein